jgi:hypothetical protein
MMRRELIFLVEDSPEGGYEAKALGESIFTAADSMSELKINIIESVQCHFEDNQIPQVIRLHYVKEEVISI